ncbi:MAG: hypothetical protein HQL69_23830 [Magnetococcales bacterium]|nr:hypothetical protein [Magnetococcales bacterium]
MTSKPENKLRAPLVAALWRAVWALEERNNIPTDDRIGLENMHDWEHFSDKPIPDEYRMVQIGKIVQDKTTTYDINNDSEEGPTHLNNHTRLIYFAHQWLIEKLLYDMSNNTTGPVRAYGIYRPIFDPANPFCTLSDTNPVEVPPSAWLEASPHYSKSISSPSIFHYMIQGPHPYWVEIEIEIQDIENYLSNNNKDITYPNMNRNEDFDLTDEFLKNNLKLKTNHEIETPDYSNNTNNNNITQEEKDNPPHIQPEPLQMLPENGGKRWLFKLASEEFLAKGTSEGKPLRGFRICEQLIKNNGRIIPFVLLDLIDKGPSKAKPGEKREKRNQEITDLPALIETSDIDWTKVEKIWFQHLTNTPNDELNNAFTNFWDVDSTNFLHDINDTGIDRNDLIKLHLCKMKLTAEIKYAKQLHNEQRRIMLKNYKEEVTTKILEGRTGISDKIKTAINSKNNPSTQLVSRALQLVIESISPNSIIRTHHLGDMSTPSKTKGGIRSMTLGLCYDPNLIEY